MAMNASSMRDTQIHPRWGMEHRGLHLVSTRSTIRVAAGYIAEAELEQRRRESRRMRMAAIAMGAGLGTIAWFGRALLMHMGVV